MSAANVAGPGCRVVDDGEEPSVAFCTLATRVAMARLSMLEHVLAQVAGAQQVLDGDEPNLALVQAMLRDAAKVDPTEPLDERVPRDEALLAVVRALQDLISTDAESLLEQALAAVNALTTSGWLLVRQAGIA
jgi:hypothetical protein